MTPFMTKLSFLTVKEWDIYQKCQFCQKMWLFPENVVIYRKLVFIYRKLVFISRICQNSQCPAVRPTGIKCFGQNGHVLISGKHGLMTKFRVYSYMLTVGLRVND